MGDWMFASESDPAQSERWEDAAGGVARRLQARLNRHLWILERLRSDPLGTGPRGLQELLDTARRMRRDTESLLLLGGQDPGVRNGPPRRLSDVLGDAVSAAEEPRRVDVRTAPAASLAPASAVEFLHVLAELLDHLTAVHPGARIGVTSRIDDHGGVTVDLYVDGAGHHDPDCPGGRSAAAAAEQLARRSRCRIELSRSTAGPVIGSGLVASVYCPAGAVTVVEQVRPWGPGSGHGSGNGSDNGNGSDHGTGAGHRTGVGRLATASMLSGPAAPPYVPSASSQVDELFGPLFDLPLEPIDDRYATPIFEAIASAWFRDAEQGAPPPPERGADPVDWESPNDGEWRAAAARAALPDPTPATPSGLPRRRPGNQLVPPRRVSGSEPAAGPAERVPDRVRDRLSTYQRGLRQGRHRAPGQDGPDQQLG